MASELIRRSLCLKKGSVSKQSCQTDTERPSGADGTFRLLDQVVTNVERSQTLNAPPEMVGGMYWTPVIEIAGALSDLILADNVPYPIYHIENQWAGPGPK